MIRTITPASETEITDPPHRRGHVFKSDNNIGTEVLRTDWRKTLLSAQVQGQFIDSVTKTCEYAH